MIYLIISAIAAIFFAALLFVPQKSCAQSQHNGYVFMAKSDSSFGWFIPIWPKWSDTSSVIATWAKMKKYSDSVSILKVNVLDTALMLLKYLRKQDTANMLLNYARSVLVALKVNITDTANMLSNYMRKYTRSDTTFTPTLNTGSRLSTTKDYDIRVYVTVGIISALTGLNQGNLTLQRSPDNTNWTTIAYLPQSITGVIATNTQTVSLSGFIPAGYYYKITTQSLGVNTATFTAQLSQGNSL